MNPKGKDNMKGLTISASTSSGDTTEPVDTDSIMKMLEQFRDKIAELEKIIREHNHTGQDGSLRLRSGFELAPSEIIQVGNMRLEEITSATGQIGYIVVGKDKDDTTASKNTQLSIENRENTDGSTNQTFIQAQRYPLYGGKHASITSSGTVATISDMKFETDELVGSHIVVLNTDGTFNTFQITSNKINSITVNGSWTFSSSNAQWTVYMPVYLGSSAYPWRQIYAGGDSVANNGNQRRAIRLGYNNTSSCQGIFFGSGSPESVVSAVVGSLYLRSDGSTSTTLYVKTSGSSTTGWTPK